MKVLLIKDVPKLGRAGDIKRVANGFGRNYLIPQRLAVIASAGALKQVEYIREQANIERSKLNNELGGIAEILEGQLFTFAVRASETGKLYGSVTTRMVVDEINAKFETEISHRQVESQPLRNLGTYEIPIRLTMDLNPVITVLLHREGEAAVLPGEEETETVEVAAEPEAVEETVAEAVEETPAE